MLVISLYLSVKRKRSEPRNHGWKADAFECKPHPAVATPHPDADYLPLLLNSIKLWCWLLREPAKAHCGTRAALMNQAGPGGGSSLRLYAVIKCNSACNAVIIVNAML